MALTKNYFLKLNFDVFDSPALLRAELAHGPAAVGVYVKIRAFLSRFGDDDGAAALDVDLIAAAIRCADKPLILAIIRDFDLFAVLDDGARFASAEEAATLKKRQEISKARAEAGRRGGRPRKAPENGPSRPADAPATPPLASESSGPSETRTPPFSDGYDDAEIIVDSNGEIVIDAAQKIEAVRKIWNEEAPPKRQTRILIPGNSPTGAAALQTSGLFAPDEIRDAFRAAIASDWGWTFKDAVKPENIERLRAQKEVKQNKRENDDEEKRTATDIGDFWKSVNQSTCREIYATY